MMNYGPYLYPYTQQNQIQGVKFVHGRAEAENCMLPYNTRAILMDTDRDFFYLKSTDANGISSITEYSFQKVENEPTPSSESYITKEEFNDWKEQYESAISKLIAAIPAKSDGSANGVRKNAKPAASSRKGKSTAQFRPDDAGAA